MASKKTFAVRKLVEFVNDRLAVSRCSDAERRAMASVLERVLHDTDTYAGYSYLALPGTADYNESRRRYYLHRNL